MAQKTRITATVVIDVVTADEAELDDACEDVHEQIGLMMVGNDWAGSVELSWKTIEDAPVAPPICANCRVTHSDPSRCPWVG